MNYQLKSGAADKQRTACLVLGIFDKRQLSEPAAQVDAASGGALSAILTSGDLDGKIGQTLLLQSLPGVAAPRILLVGCGKASSFNDNQYRRAVRAAATALGRTAAKDAWLGLSLLDVSDRDAAWKIKQAVLACEDVVYRFEELKDKKAPAAKLKKWLLAVTASSKALQSALASAVATAEGVALTKTLGNRPGNLCTPSDLAKLAKQLAKQHESLSTRVLDEAEMKKLGMGALLSVSRGSRQPAKLIAMTHAGGKKGDKPVVLVGKGLTFDAGGISLKPAQKMEEMKFDMCGGATVFGVMQAVAALQLPLNVVGVVPSSENLPDGDANKPGDVVKSMAGISIEIINTDAEGRLILCDALTWAQQEFDPEVLIDMATLTGACVVALDKHASGLFSNHQPLAAALAEAGELAGDRAWQLPLWEDYQAQLKSPVADVANVGGAGGGSITAACFLHRFTRKARWAHLDIAGTAWGDNKLGTGRPVPLLMEYLLKRAGTT